jgi:hypothetical protein
LGRLDEPSEVQAQKSPRGNTPMGEDRAPCCTLRSENIMESGKQRRPQARDGEPHTEKVSKEKEDEMTDANIPLRPGRGV